MVAVVVEVVVWGVQDVGVPVGELGQLFGGHLGQWQFDVEESVVAEAGLQFALGQVNVGQFSGEDKLAVELAHDVVFLAFLDVVGGFDDDATFLAVEGAGDFFRLESWLK